MRNKFVILSILAVAFLLRFIDIDSNPPSLYGDELTITLDAYSLLKTGKDQLGNWFPLTFEMGAGRPAGYVYFSIPFVAIFGPTALGVRMLSILSGLGIIILLYFLGKKLFSSKIGLVAAFMVSISPWDISLSRVGFEAHFALFLALLGGFIFLLAKEKPVLYLISALVFGLTVHTYPTYKLILPLFLVILLWFQYGSAYPFKIKEFKFLLGGLGVLGIFGVLALIQTFSAGSEERFSEINIFSQLELKEKIIQKINFERSITGLPSNISVYFFNKPLEYLKVYGENYLQNFSVDFLFLHGDGNPRHNMASLGQFYFIDLLLLLLGLVSIKQKKVLVFLLIWISIAPLATAFISKPNSLRSAFMFPPLILLISSGFDSLLNKERLRRIALVIICFTLLLQLAYFIQRLYFLSPNEHSRFWSYPAKLASDIAIKNKDKFDYIILSDKIDNIEYAYPVYAKVNPLDVISQNQQKFELNGYKFKRFQNVYIGNIPEAYVETFINDIVGSALFVGDPIMINYLDNYESLQNKDGLAGLVLKKKYK